MTKKEELVFDLELQIEWIRDHTLPGWLNVTETVRRAIAWILGAENEMP